MENVLSTPICVEPILLNRKSTSYNIYINYFNENNPYMRYLNEHNQQENQYIGTQMNSEICKFYPIPLHIMDGEVTFTVKWIENVVLDLHTGDAFKKVK